MRRLSPRDTYQGRASATAKCIARTFLAAAGPRAAPAERYKKSSCQLCDTPGNLMKRFAFVAHLLTRTDSGRATTFEEINAIHTRLDCGFNSGSSVCYFWMQWMQLHHSQWHSNNRFQTGWSLQWLE